MRSAYREHVEEVDEWVGRLIGRGARTTRSCSCSATRHRARRARLPRARHARPRTATSYEIPYLIRHPDGEKGGDDVDWYASTHDVAPTLLSFLGLTIPGKMGGEDLTALFDDVDEGDSADRPYSITASGSQIIVRDDRWLMVADREQIERRLYDDDEEAEDDIKRYDDVANEEPGVLTELSLAALAVAGGTLPEFGPDGALRPPRSAATTTSTTTASRTTSTPVDNDEPDDDDDAEATSSSTGATPRTGSAARP